MYQHEVPVHMFTICNNIVNSCDIWLYKVDCAQQTKLAAKTAENQQTTDESNLTWLCLQCCLYKADQ